MAFFPFGNAYGVSCTGGTSLFARVGTTPLPEWAAEFDAKTWAQFFLKYVISHPAVTVVRTGTTKAAHMLDNIGGGIGRLPNEATRKRMAELIDALPAGSAAARRTARHRHQGLRCRRPSSTATSVSTRRRPDSPRPSAATGTTLFVKPGTNPEAPLLARSETRFQDPRGPFFEFQLDGQGKVTGAVLEQQGPQGTQRIPLERK